MDNKFLFIILIILVIITITTLLLGNYLPEKPEDKIIKFSLPALVEAESQKPPAHVWGEYKLMNLLNPPKYTYKGANLINAKVYEDYFEEEYIIYTKQNTFIHGYLLTPLITKKKYPVIFTPHNHGNNYDLGAEEVIGHKGDPSLSYGKELAERGYIVLATNSPLFGYRNIIGNNAGETREEIYAQSLFNLGRTLTGVVIAEDIVALDFLESLDFVDGSKIGCIGNSLGGNRCMYLSALDSKIKAVALLNSVTDINRTPTTGVVQTWFNVIPGLGKYFNTEDILNLIKGEIYIFHTENDPINKVSQTKEIIKRLNKEVIYKEAENKSHEFPKEYHEEVYEFFDKHLRKER
ncbi:MAG: dienelactone hydrolase family protein [Nanoarchaeota archaeon]